MILVIDFGGQLTNVIIKKLRSYNFHSETIFYTRFQDFIKDKVNEIDGFIISGSDKSVHDSDDIILQYNIIELILKSEKPLLGICYGYHLISHYFKGKISNEHSGEFGFFNLILNENKNKFKFLDDFENSLVLMNHGDSLIELPENFISLGSTAMTKYAIIKHNTKDIYGVQFHPESDHSTLGSLLLRNFGLISKSQQTWSSDRFLSTCIEGIDKTLKSKDGDILCAVSGGVDSTVSTVLLTKVVDTSRIKAVFIDTGLLRYIDKDRVSKIFSKFNIKVDILDIQDKMFEILKGVSDPELKRLKISKIYQETLEKYSEKCQFLMQGTIYPDVIESGATGASKIKSHHNLMGKMARLELIEPIRCLFKDEVRALGQTLDIPSDFLKAHPFPGPGLGVRVLGEVTREKIDILQRVEHTCYEFVNENGLYDQSWQLFTVLLNDKSVGIKGDKRFYGYVCAVRSICSNDGMTGSVTQYKIETLEKLASHIVNNVKEICRVVYDITSKPPASIEWE